MSGLNADRKGSLKDARSNLFTHLPRVYLLCKKFFRWAQVHYLMESVASMDSKDRIVMSKEIGCLPWRLDAGSFSLCRRPRLYWVSWELRSAQGVVVTPPSSSEWDAFGVVELTAEVDVSKFITSGWTPNCEVFPTFTTSRPRSQPGNRPAGLWQCSSSELDRWRKDRHRYPPYVYREVHLLSNSQGEMRLPSIREKETIMGFPCDFTAPCVNKNLQQGEQYLDIRHSLIGNTWHVPSITWLLKELFSPLGMTPICTLNQVIEICTPGTSQSLATYLRRPPLKQQRVPLQPGSEVQLTKRLVNFISIKGEDLLLQAKTENQVKFHRLRTSIPSRLWRWRVICGWPWQYQGFHINALELQAVLTTLQWRLCRKHDMHCRFVHLTDSLVTLHTLSRGRSSSRPQTGRLGGPFKRDA